MKFGAIYEPIYYPLKFDNLTYFDQLNTRSRNLLQWVMYSCERDCDGGILGVNKGEGGKTGMLGMVEPTFYSTIGYRPDPTNLTKMVPKTVPFFLDSSSTTINESINNEIYNRLELLSTLNFN